MFLIFLLYLSLYNKLKVLLSSILIFKSFFLSFFSLYSFFNTFGIYEKYLSGFCDLKSLNQKILPQDMTLLMKLTMVTKLIKNTTIKLFFSTLIYLT